MAVTGKRSSVDWDEILKNKAVTQVATMTLPNTAKRHDGETNERLLRNLRRRSPKLKRILGLSMAVVNDNEQ